MGWVILAAVAVYVFQRLALGYPSGLGRYRCLMRGEVALLSSTAEAMFPPGGPIEPSGRDADLPGYLDRFLIAAQPRNRMLMHALVFLVEHGTLLFPAPGRGGRRRFSSLRYEQRVAALDGWAHSRFFLRRLCFNSLRALLTMGYFAHPPVLRGLGVAPYEIATPVCEADLFFPPIGSPAEAVTHQAADLTAPSDGTPIPLDAPLHPAYREDAP